MSFRYAALILIAVNALAFFVQVLVESFTGNFLLESADIYARPWILVTSMFLHGGYLHLFGNMFALFLFGLILEKHIGTGRFLAVYFASGILAGFASAYFYESALGASGAIFGVLGALAVLQPRTIVWTYGVPMPMFVAAGFWLFLDVAGVFYPTDVANIAHIAGLFFGAVIGIGIKQTTQTKHQKDTKEKIVSDKEFERWEDEWV